MTFVGVCGGRDFDDRRLADRILESNVTADDVIVHGDSAGADRIAGAWAFATNHFQVKVPAPWNKMGKSAGMRRNAVIAALPLRLLIAFPGGVGTAGMVRLARSRAIPVLEVQDAEVPK